MTDPVSQLVLRDLTEDDLGWVASQEVEIFGPAAWSESLIRDDFRWGGKLYRGVEVDGALVAYAVFGYDGDAFHLMNLAVASSARRRGVARVLVDDFLAEAATQGASDAWLEVSVENEAALALYRAYGFEDVRIRPRYYQPEDVDGLVMRLRLTDKVE